MATKKQVEANKENSKHGGVKTPQGKEIAKWNALKHGLLAREVVIDAGDGEENRQEFDSLLAKLRDQLQPVGTLEEILVEKIATSYWRHRRLLRYEVGLIRANVDDYRRDYYFPGNNEKTQRSVQSEIDRINQDLESFFEDPDDKDHVNINPGKILENDWDINIDWYYKELVHSDEEIPWQESFASEEDEDEIDSGAVYAWLIDSGWTPEKIKKKFVSIAKAKLKTKQSELKQAKAQDETRLSQIAKASVLNLKGQTDVIIRYENSILRQFYRALHELERLQKSRQGIVVPPPIAVDVEIEQSSE